MLDNTQMFDETIKVYIIDNNGLYRGDYDILSHKLAEEVYYTLIAPPEKEENKLAVFDRDKETWTVVNDFRGQPIYDSETKNYGFVDYIGDLRDNHSFNLPENVDMAKQAYF